MPSRVPIYLVDAFADRPFAGNPAGVVLVDSPLPEELMQSIAAEMKHAETAFVQRGENGYGLRWLTPETEVVLCGHATLASAFVLFETGALVDGQTARFHTLSGELTATRVHDGVELDFPVVPSSPIQDGSLDALHDVLSARPVALGRTSMDILAELRDEAAVRSLEVDLDKLLQIDTRGLIVTARSDSPDYDFVSRFFAPRVGVPEDPVTGSAHCCLADYWSSRLGKTRLVGYQASKRGGVVRTELRGDRVLLQGKCEMILSGSLHL